MLSNKAPSGALFFLVPDFIRGRGQLLHRYLCQLAANKHRNSAFFLDSLPQCAAAKTHVQ